MSSSEEQLRSEVRESFREIHEIKDYMLVALGFADRPLQPSELAKALPESIKPRFYSRAHANPYYESRGNEMVDSYVGQLLVDAPMGLAAFCAETPYYGGLQLTALGEGVLESALEDPTKLGELDEVIEKIKQYTPF